MNPQKKIFLAFINFLPGFVLDGNAVSHYVLADSSDCLFLEIAILMNDHQSLAGYHLVWVLKVTYIIRRDREFFLSSDVCLSVRSTGHSFQAILMKLGTRIPCFLTILSRFFDRWENKRGKGEVCPSLIGEEANNRKKAREVYCQQNY